MNKQVFSGVDGLKSYLTPDRHAYIPLVELPDSLNEFRASHDIHISVKLMNTLPLGNVKSLPAHSLLSSQPIGGRKVVESSSGNTVFSMGLLAPQMGAKAVRAIASNDVSDGKLKLLRLAGVEIELHDGPICPDANDPDSTIVRAHRRGMQDGWVNPGQYDNDANPRAHEAITGPQLYDQLGDGLGMLVAGLGTTGTLVGTARYLRRQLPGIKIGGATRVPNNHVPGVRTQRGLREVAFNWHDVLTDPPVAINEYDAYASSLAMIRSGLLVGPSAGFALAAAKRLIARYIERDNASVLQGKHVVVICPDSCFPYVDEYFDVLGESAFPEVSDFSTRRYEESSDILGSVPEITIDELYADTVNGQAKHYTIMDVREPREYEDHHISGSKNIPLHAIDVWAKGADQTQRYVFVCSRVQRSARAAYVAQQAGLSAYLLEGGTAAWTDAGYDRVQPAVCEV